MTRRLLLALAAVLAFVGAVVAQPQQPRPLQPGDAINGRFMQERHLTGVDAPLRSEGSFLLAAGKGLIWRGEKPFATMVVITPAGILQTVNGAEVQRLPATRLPFLARFYDMLSGALAGDWSAMEHDFTVARQSEGDSWKIVLTPSRGDDPAAAQLRSITVTGAKFVDAVEIRRANGDWEHLRFFDQALTSTPLAPDDARLFEQAGR
ncbi:MAG TPA: outer membrane lipoprotein carrier protein LolA [Stellaceae bacterium]|nr:outer membrane lipoprotein carrier protein LolA [Stellaceae bacterium]